MRTQIFSLLTFVLTASACSVPTEETDTQAPSEITIEMETATGFLDDGVTAPAPSGFVIVDESAERLLDTPDSMLVESIPEIGVLVYELEAGTQLDNEVPHQKDKLISIDNNVRLADSDLGDALRDDKNRVVGFIGAIPKDIEEIGYDQQHRLVVFAQGEEALYESELIRELVKSTEGPIEYVHIPVPQDYTSEMLHSAIEYVQSEGIRVFDLNGNVF